MTEAIIKKLGVFDENTRKHRFTIVLKKIILDKPYHIHCDEDGNLIDLRKSKSHANLSYTDKLKQVKGFYTIEINKSKSCDDKCYVKLPTKFDYNLATILQIAQKTISSNVVFVMAGCSEAGLTEWYYDRLVIKNNIHSTHRRYLSVVSGAWDAVITEDLLGEDIPTPDSFMKQIKAREDRERKKQNRITLFETFILPGLDIEGIKYDRDDQAFWIRPDDAVKVFKKHIEEVIIPKLKEIGVQISVDEFNVQGLQYCRKIPLKKVKLDNIDDVE